jgi:DNA-binding NarL/FixJ family response regulator
MALSEFPVPIFRSSVKQESTFGQVNRGPTGLGTLNANIYVICDSEMLRTCLMRCLQCLWTETDDFVLRSYRDVAAWSNELGCATRGIVLLCVLGESGAEACMERALVAIEKHADLRVVVISDVEQPAIMRTAIDQGASAYIPMNMEFHVVLWALRLVGLGGRFLPVSCLSATECRPPLRRAVDGEKIRERRLTPREIAVLRHLCEGDPNKVIARKLGITDGTVKVHVRAMMKKVRARNRTQLASKMS